MEREERYTVRFFNKILSQSFLQKMKTNLFFNYNGIIKIRHITN